MLENIRCNSHELHFITQKKRTFVSMKYQTVLTIAGSDPSGGAGIQADIKTISACGCYATSAITAITIQNTQGVQAVQAIPADIIYQQIKCVSEDIEINAIKIGMLHSAEVVNMLAAWLKDHPCTNIVLDPVMVSTSGHRLLDENAIISMTQNLFPLVRVITPNIPEAEVLLGQKIQQQEDIAIAAKKLANKYHTSVWLKAGHLHADVLVDICYDVEAQKIYELPGVRIRTKNTHGTGCTLSSALASMLAKGLSLEDSARKAKEYMNQAIRHGADFEIGLGQGPVHHFWNLWSENKQD